MCSHEVSRTSSMPNRRSRSTTSSPATTRLRPVSQSRGRSRPVELAITIVIESDHHQRRRPARSEHRPRGREEHKRDLGGGAVRHLHRRARARAPRTGPRRRGRTGASARHGGGLGPGAGRGPRAKPGNRTVVDALQPFVEALKATGGDLAKAVRAAERGCESTKGMRASLGRSVYAGGEEWRNCPDPGTYGLLAFLRGSVQ